MNGLLERLREEVMMFPLLTNIWVIDSKGETNTEPGDNQPKYGNWDYYQNYYDRNHTVLFLHATAAHVLWWQEHYDVTLTRGLSWLGDGVSQEKSGREGGEGLLSDGDSKKYVPSCGCSF